MAGCVCNRKADFQQSKFRSLRVNSQVDPTKTAGLRRSFKSAMDKKFLPLRSDIITSIVKNDCFNLNPKNVVGLSRLVIVNAPAAVKQFDFPRSSDKVNGFMDWLKEQQGNDLLTVSKRAGRQIGGEVSWMDTYIESAYKQGILNAQSAMVKKGIEFVQRDLNTSFFRPLHADRVGLLYTRSFNDLKGITDEMDKQISRVLAQGLVDGLSPLKIARALTDRVDKVGITRARTLARTEIIHAHAEATLNEFEEAGLDGVEVEAEWLTAGFDVCPICEELSGKVFSIKEAHSMLPAHPNCKCTWLPVIEKENKR